MLLIWSRRSGGDERRRRDGRAVGVVAVVRGMEAMVVGLGSGAVRVKLGS